MNERFAFDDICICLFLYFCEGFLFLFYLFVIIIIFFSSSTLLFMRTKEREIISCFWLEFIMMMVILSCSSQWQTEDALGHTLCICVFFPCICILALFFCSLKPYFFTKKFCIPWWIIIDPSMQHCIGCMECLGEPSNFFLGKLGILSQQGGGGSRQSQLFIKIALGRGLVNLSSSAGKDWF